MTQYAEALLVDNEVDSSDEFTIASEDMIVSVRRGFDLKGRVMQCRYGMHGGCSLQH